MRPQRHQPVAPAFVEAMQPPFHLGERLAALGLGLGRHQVGDPLRLGEVEAACLEGAAGELAWLGRTKAGKCPERIEQLSEDGKPAMDVEFRHVLAGGAAGRREPEGKAAVDGLACFRLAEAPERGLARLGQRLTANAPSAIRAAGPETRTTAMAARPPPLDSAKMVSPVISRTAGPPACRRRVRRRRLPPPGRGLRRRRPRRGTAGRASASAARPGRRPRDESR